MNYSNDPGVKITNYNTITKVTFNTTINDNLIKENQQFFNITQY